MRKRLVVAAFAVEEHAEAVVGLGEVGLDGEGGEVVGLGFVGAAFGVEGGGEAFVHEVVALGDGERALEEGLTRTPVADLAICEGGEGEEHDAGERKHGPARKGHGRGEVGDEPDGGEREADKGQIGVAVGHRLGADLHEADYRDEHAEVPAASRRGDRGASARGRGRRR